MPQTTGVSVVGRLLFAALFLSAGLYKLATFDFETGGHKIVEMSGMGRRMDDFLGELASVGLPVSMINATWYPVMMLAAIGLEVIGSILMILNRPLGARMLLLFLASVTPVMHPFWKENNSNGGRGHDDMVQFYKNISLAGARVTELSYTIIARLIHNKNNHIVQGSVEEWVPEDHDGSLLSIILGIRFSKTGSDGVFSFCSSLLPCCGGGHARGGEETSTTSRKLRASYRAGGESETKADRVEAECGFNRSKSGVGLGVNKKEDLEENNVAAAGFETGVVAEETGKAVVPCTAKEKSGTAVGAVAQKRSEEDSLDSDQTTGGVVVDQVETRAVARDPCGGEGPSVMEVSAAYGKSTTFPPSRQGKMRLSKTLEEPLFSGSDFTSMNECPPHGCKSVMGRRAKMEDTFVAIPHLLDIAFADSMNEIIPPRIQDQLKTVKDGTSCAGDLHLGGLGRGKIANESLHFFGVFDGHGGADAANHCKDTMHERLKEVILASELGFSESESADAKDEIVSGKEEDVLVSGGSNAEVLEKSPTSKSKEILFNLSRVSTSSDMAVRHGIIDVDGVKKDEDENGDAVTANCSSEAISNALAKAFKLTDEAFAELGNEEQLSLVGTTAVVALISSRSIYVANTGDSRAVLSRNGRAAALTDDHKAAREDETARVEAAGGQILFWNGVRVMGLLAVSRAIGDHSLRPYVIADPELTVVNRHPGDELLVLASDGLWDVMSNQEACALAKKCLLRARQKGSTRESAARVAATVLTRAAVDRGSRDNVTVLVVDLMQDPDDLLEADALKMRLSGEIVLEQNCIDSKSSNEKETIAAENIENQQNGGEEDTSEDKTMNVETSMKLEDPPPPPLEIGLSGSFRSPFEMMDDSFDDK